MSDVKDNQPEFYPLPVNILKLQYFTDFFDLTEIILFSWFIVKARSFKYQQFYYSRPRISQEVLIKEDRLITIIKRFTDLGIIEIEMKGLPRQHHFTVNFEQIKCLIPQIFQSPENSRLAPESSLLTAFFSRLVTENQLIKRNIIKKSIKEDLEEEIRIEEKGEETPSFSKIFDEESLEKKIESDKEKKAREAAERKAQKEKEHRAAEKTEKIDRLTRLLIKTYETRLEMFNREKVKGERVRKMVSLGIMRRDHEALYELGKQYDEEQIRSSFMVLVDDFLKGESGIKKPVPYFLARNKDTGDFDTCYTCLNKFMEEYAYEKQ